MTLFSDCCESLRCMVTGWTSGISTWMRLWVKTSPRMTRCNTLFFGCLVGRSWGARSRWSLLTASSLARRLRKGRCSSLLTPQCLPRTSWTSTEAYSRLSIFTAMQSSLPSHPLPVTEEGITGLCVQHVTLLYPRGEFFPGAAAWIFLSLM